MANHLVIGEPLTKGFALTGPGNSFLHTHSRISLHTHGHRHALGIKIGHDDLEALILLANQLVDRDSHIIKIERRGIRRPPALLAL